MIGLVIAAVVSAGPGAGGVEAAHAYQRELRRQCPTKRLEWMGPAVLQDELLKFKVPASATTRMERGWRTQCDPDSYTSSCGNTVALVEIRRAGLMKRFVAGLCREWRCEEPAVCDRAVPKR